MIDKERWKRIVEGLECGDVGGWDACCDCFCDDVDILVAEVRRLRAEADIVPVGCTKDSLLGCYECRGRDDRITNLENDLAEAEAEVRRLRMLVSVIEEAQASFTAEGGGIAGAVNFHHDVWSVIKHSYPEAGGTP